MFIFVQNCIGNLLKLRRSDDNTDKVALSIVLYATTSTARHIIIGAFR